MKKIIIIVLLCLISFSPSASSKSKSESEYVSADIYVRYLYWSVADITALTDSKFDPYVIKEANVDFKNLFGFELLMNYMTNKFLNKMDFKSSDSNEVLNGNEQIMQGILGSLFFPFNDDTETRFGIGFSGNVKTFKANATLKKSMPYYSEDGSFVVINKGDNINYFSNIKEYRVFFGLSGQGVMGQLYLGLYNTSMLRGIALDTSYAEGRDDILLPYSVVTMETNRDITLGLDTEGRLNQSNGFGLVFHTLMSGSFLAETYTSIFKRKEGNLVMQFGGGFGIGYQFGSNFYIEVGGSAGFNWWSEQFNSEGEMTKDIVIWNTDTNVTENVAKGTKITVENAQRFDFLYGPYFKVSLRF